MIDMRNLLIKIFFPADNIKQALPSACVIAILSVGIGIFWTIQIVSSNFYHGLIERILQVKEEISIAHNPDKKFMSSEDEDDEFFNGATSSILDRAKISQQDYKKIASMVGDNGGMTSAPLIKKPDFGFSVGEGDGRCFFKCLLIGADRLPDKNNILRILDRVSPPSLVPDGCIPVYLSSGLIPQVKKGDTFTISFESRQINCYCVDFLPQDLFAIPILLMPVANAQQVLNSNKFTLVGIRVNGRGGRTFVKAIEDQLGDEYVVSYWEDSLKTLSSVFSSINFIIETIVSSLFIIAFLFSLVALDAMIKKKRTDLAILLAMGMPPQQIRRALLYAAFIMGCIGCVGGYVLSFVFLKLIPQTRVGSVLSTMYINDFSFRFEWEVAILVFFIAFLVTIASAWFAGKRIFTIDPIEDLRK